MQNYAKPSENDKSVTVVIVCVCVTINLPDIYEGGTTTATEEIEPVSADHRPPFVYFEPVLLFANCR